MRLRIEAGEELTHEEAAAVRAALERYATATGSATGAGERGRWTRVGREEAIRGRRIRPEGRAAWQEARDRRRPERDRVP